MKKVFATAKASRARATKFAKLDGNIPHEINILGENVRLFEGMDFKGRAGAASFQREYFPDIDDEETLNFARKVFATVFMPGSRFDYKFPLYPCDSREREFLKRGLVYRFFSLRATLLELMDYEDSRILEKRAAYEHLMRLKDLIELMDRIYEENNQACIDNYDPSTGRFRVPMNLEDQEALKNLLRQFVFLVLQGNQPLDNWSDRQSMDAVEFLERLKEQTITKEDMIRYLQERDANGYKKIPLYLNQLMEDIQSKDLAASLDCEEQLLVIYNKLLDVLTTFTETSETARDILRKIESSGAPTQQKILEMINLLSEMYRFLEKQLDECEKREKEYGKKLEAARLMYRDLEAQKGKVEERLDTASVAAATVSMASTTGFGAALKAAPTDSGQVDAVKGQLGIVQAEAARLRDTAEQTEAGASTAAAKIATLEDEKTALMASANTLKLDLEGLRAQLSQAVETAEANKAQIEALKAEKKSAEDQQAALKKAADEAAADVERIQAERKTEIARLKADHAAAQANLTKKIAQLPGQARDTIALQREIVETQDDQTRQAEKGVARASGLVKQLTDQIRNAEARIVVERQKMDALDTQIKSGAEGLKTLNNQLAEAKAKRRQTPLGSEEGKGIQATIDDLKRRIDVTEAEQQTAIVNFQRGAQMVRSLEEAARNFRENLDTAKREEAAVISQFEALNSALEAQRKEFAKLLQTTQQQIAAEKDSKTKDIEALRAEAAAAAAAKEQESAEKLSATRREFQEKLSAAAATHNAAQEALKNRAAELGRSIQNLNANIRTQQSAHRAEIVEQQRKHEVERGRLQEALQKEKKERAELQAKLNEQIVLVAAKTKEITTLKDEIETLKKTIEEKDAAIEKVKGEREELKSKLKVAGEELEGKEAEIAEANGKIQELEARLAERNTRIQALDYEAVAIEERSRQLQEIIDGLNGELGVAKEAVASATAAAASKGAELATVTEELQKSQESGAAAAAQVEALEAERAKLQADLEQQAAVVAAAATEKEAAEAAKAAAEDQIQSLQISLQAARAQAAEARAQASGLRQTQEATAQRRIARAFRRRRKVPVVPTAVAEPDVRPDTGPSKLLVESPQLFEEEESAGPSANLFDSPTERAARPDIQPPDDKDYARLGLSRGASWRDVQSAWQREGVKVHPKLPGGNYDEYLNLLRSYRRIVAFIQKKPRPSEESILAEVAQFKPAQLSTRQAKTRRNRRVGQGAAEAGMARPSTNGTGVSRTTRRKRARRAAAFNAAVGTATNVVEPVAVAAAATETGAQKRARWNRLSRGQGTPENRAIQAAAAAASGSS